MAPAAPGRALAADAALLGITAIWGTTFVVVKDALDDADPFSFLALRFTLAAVVATLLARGALRDRAAWRGGLVLGVLLFTGFAFQTLGLASTTPARSAFITGLCVILVPFMSFAVTRARPGFPALVGVAFSVAGLYALTGFDLSAPGSRGEVLTLGCTFAYAAHVALTQRYAAHTTPLALVTVQLIVTAVLSTLAAALGSPHVAAASPSLWFGVVVTALFASVGALVVQAWAQARTSAVHAAIIFSVESIFAAACSAALGRETLGPRELVGGALLLAGVVVTEVGAAVLRRTAVRAPVA